MGPKNNNIGMSKQANYLLVILLVVTLLGLVFTFMFYYLPILFVIEIIILIRYDFDKIPNLKVINTICEYKEQFLYRVNYHKLRVYRC